MAQTINLGRVAGPNLLDTSTATTYDGILTADGERVGAKKLLPVSMGGTGADTLEAAKLALGVVPPLYERGGRDLSLELTAQELHEAIAAGDFSMIRMGDYWPVSLTGSFMNYGANASATLSGAAFKLEFMPNFYKGYSDNAVSPMPSHCLVCSRELIGVLFKMRTSTVAWSDTEATNPFAGSHLFKTLNAADGLISLIEQTELGPYIYAGPNGSGMRFMMETKGSGVTDATGVHWGDRGKLFLPTESEVWGHAVFSEPVYGMAGSSMQWPIFAGTRRYLTKNTQGTDQMGQAWWTSSSVAGSATSFCTVGVGGVCATVAVNRPTGIPLCFIIA